MTWLADLLRIGRIRREEFGLGLDADELCREAMTLCLRAGIEPQFLDARVVRLVSASRRGCRRYGKRVIVNAVLLDPIKLLFAVGSHEDNRTVLRLLCRSFRRDLPLPTRRQEILCHT